MKKPDYFPVLDSVRSIACLLVFLSHSVVFFGYPGGAIAFGNFLKNAGYYGVIYFYSLSGFLITYLLLREKSRTGTIALRRFYVRRALRIWPLYYLMVLLAFFVLRYYLPGAYLQGPVRPTPAFLLFILLLPNVAVLQGFYMSTCFHLYTIGYEEQYYLIWPLVVRKISDRPAIMLAGAFFLPLLLGIVHQYLHSHSVLDGDGWKRLLRGGLTFVDLANIPAFAAGGAAAYLYLEMGERQQRSMARPFLGYALLAVLVALMVWGRPWVTGYVNLIAVVFVSLLLHLISRGEGWGKGRAFFSVGGKLSYGVYVYHPTILMLVSGYISKKTGLFGGSAVAGYLLYLFLSLVLVVGVAGLSYVGFERVFLRMKRR